MKILFRFLFVIGLITIIPSIIWYIITGMDIYETDDLINMY